MKAANNVMDGVRELNMLLEIKRTEAVILRACENGFGSFDDFNLFDGLSDEEARSFMKTLGHLIENARKSVISNVAEKVGQDQACCREVAGEMISLAGHYVSAARCAFDPFFPPAAK